eukprot:5819662-Ditylum_brightwellii.AAC.1
MVLGKEEFHDQVLMHYVITSKDLPKVCNGCGKWHTLQHALQCHFPHAVHSVLRVQSGWDGKRKGDDPVDYQAQADKDGGVQVIKKKDKDKDKTLIGDVLMHHLWCHQTDTIIDVRITDMDAK